MHKGVLSDDQLQLALAEQQRSGAPLGEILVRLGFVVGPTIANALAEQHGGPLRTEYGLSIGPTREVGTPPDPARNLKPVPDPAGAEAANARRELDALRLTLEGLEAGLASAKLQVAALVQALTDSR